MKICIFESKCVFKVERIWKAQIMSHDGRYGSCVEYINVCKHNGIWKFVKPWRYCKLNKWILNKCLLKNWHGVRKLFLDILWSWFSCKNQENNCFWENHGWSYNYGERWCCTTIKYFCTLINFYTNKGRKTSERVKAEISVSTVLLSKRQ